MAHYGNTVKRRVGRGVDLMRIGVVTLMLSIVFGWLIAWLPFETWLLTAPLLIVATGELMKRAHRRVRFRGALLVVSMMAIGVGAMSITARSLPDKYLQQQLSQTVETPDRSITLQELAGDDGARPAIRFVHFDLRDGDGEIPVTFPAERSTYRKVIESIESQTPYQHRARARCGNAWSIRWGHDSGYDFWFVHLEDWRDVR